MKNHLLLIGNGGHYRVTKSILDKNYYNKISNIRISLPLNYKNIEKNKKILNNFYKDHKNEKIFIFICIGFNYHRFLIYSFLKEQIKFKFLFPTIISKHSFISDDVKIGYGTIIMPGVVINSNSKIGKQCIINTNSSIDHDNFVSDFVSIAPGVNTGGNVKIGSHSHLGIGSKIIHNLKINKNVIIGGGSFINRGCNSNSVYYGVPGRLIKKRKLEDIYL